MVHSFDRPHGAVLLAAVLALAAIHPGETLAADQRIGTITAVRGPVSVRRSGDDHVHQVVRSDAVMLGDVVSTGAAGRARVTLADDSMMTLAEGSAVRVNQFAFDPGLNRRTAVVRVLKGQVRITVYKVRSPESDLTVQSATALISIDNLVDCVISDGAGSSDVTVLEQSLRVRNLLSYIVGEVRLGQNQKVVVGEKSPPSATITILPDERRKFMKGFIVR